MYLIDIYASRDFYFLYKNDNIMAFASLSPVFPKNAINEGMLTIFGELFE